MRNWFLLVLCLVLLIPSVASPTGTLTIPNVLANLSGTQPASLLDTNWSQIASYVNAREITIGLATNRPAAGTAGRYYFATDTNGGTLYADTGSAWQQIAPSLVTVLAQELAGLGLSNDATNPSTTVDIAVGAASSDDAVIANRILISLTSAITKTTGTWTVGTGNGGLDTGSIAASTWYHVWVIERTDTGVVDALLSTSATSPTMPTNYTKKRRIGAVLTDASKAINFFTQDGDYFTWATATMTAVTNPGTSASSVTLNTPAGVPTQAIVLAALRNAGTASSLLLSDLAVVDQTPMAAGTAAFTVPLFSLVNNSATSSTSITMVVRTNTSSQIRFRLSASDANVSAAFGTVGWYDRRGRG